MESIFNLQGVNALVTGSSKGIGRGIADYFNQTNAMALYHGRSLESRPDQVEPENFLTADLLEETSPEQLVDKAFSRCSELNTLIANAGSAFNAPTLEMDLETFRKTLRLNVEASFEVCQHFARRLAAEGRPGSIVIISSTNAFQAEENSVAYDTSKGALRMMTKSLAVSLAPNRIRVNGVAPGLIRTPLTEGGFDRNPGRVAHYERKILLKRIGSPEECAGACAFLASDAARYITGEIIIVDGGLTTGQIGRMPENETN